MSESSASSISTDAARRAARNVGAIALAQIVSKGALFAWQLVLIPLLGKSAYGIYTTVTAFFLVGVAVASFGMGNIVIREVARRTALAGKYLSATLFYQTILALVAYLGINAVAALGDYTPEVRGFVAVAGLSLFVDQLGTMVYEQLLAREQMVTTSLVEIGTVIVRIVLTALALVAGLGLVGVYAATILSGLARALVLWRALLADGVRPEFPLDRALVRNLFADATPLALAAFVNQAYTQLDRLVTGRFIPEGVAYLGAAFIIIVGMVELLSTTVLIAVFPIMSRTYSENPVVFRALVSRL
ncbi:MAG: oligosaccharide flippase family protein, partial [Anaerolineae bacterium]|nr:oligosaccharide flippase family protein [Anaerolineae bacterium]